MRVAAIIPAWNEAETIGPVIAAALSARTVGEVIVVDNGSTDATAEVAASYGVRVIVEPIQGKGEAMRRGVASTDADTIVFLDADLYGLEPRHVDALANRILSGRADMACGLCDRGSTRNTLGLHYLPILSGQRALRRDLFEALAPEEASGYRVEVALNSLVAQRKLRRRVFILTGVRHRTKEDKAPNPVTGFGRKLRMLVSAYWTYVSFSFRHRVLDEIAAARPNREW
ncbi:MAG TPA: glycosyltransferase [Thermoanaerobaculia bacterium]|nr:glycosyltransferase [Thermoanaerobaculia bacterium]